MKILIMSAYENGVHEIVSVQRANADYSIWGRTTEGTDVWLGKYDDEKRAREVVKEIFEVLKNEMEEANEIPYYVMPEK